MELVKFASKEKRAEDIFREVTIKNHEILSSTFRLISEEYPKKFGEKINGSINGDTITLTGDLDILKTEVYDKIVEYNGEKRSYKIILRKSQA